MGELFLLMLAGGALGGAAAAVLGAAPWVQAVVFALVSLLLIGGVRPLARRRLLAGLPDEQTNTAALAGRSATVLERIDGESGLIRLAGDTWTARPLFDGEVFGEGDHVFVHEIRGATAVVVRGA